jgi:transposase-like protein
MRDPTPNSLSFIMAWYVAYPISYRQLEEMRGERGVAVDHSTLNRWIIKYAPEVEKQFRRRQRPVGKSWRMDETYVRIKGQWQYVYRAVLRSVLPKWWRHQGWGAKTAEVFDNLSAVEV